MQRVREIIEKWKNVDDAIEELRKGWNRNLIKLFDLFKEILNQTDAKWSMPIEDEKVLFTYSERNGAIIKETIRGIEEGSFTIEMTPIQESIEQTLGYEWNTNFSMSKKQFTELKSSVSKQLSEGLRQLIKILGTSASHPKIFGLVSRLINENGFSEESNKLLRELLKSVGSIAAGPCFSYIDTNKICESVIEDLNQLTASDNVTLGNAKSLRLKRPGNGAQHRRKKIMMRKSVTTKLAQVLKSENQEVSTASIPLVISSLNLLSQYMLSSPVQRLTLGNLFLIQVPKMSLELVPAYLRTLTLYSLDTNKGQKRVIALLNSLLKNTDLRATCRLYLYMINKQLS